jgi:hypothetical protein
MTIVEVRGVGTAAVDYPPLVNLHGPHGKWLTLNVIAGRLAMISAELSGERGGRTQGSHSTAQHMSQNSPKFLINLP